MVSQPGRVLRRSRAIPNGCKDLYDVILVGAHWNSIYFFYPRRLSRDDDERSVSLK